MALKRIIDPQVYYMDCSRDVVIMPSHVFCILSTQKCNVLAPTIRLNASALFVFRLKNVNEVNAFLEWWTQATSAKCIIKP